MKERYLSKNLFTPENLYKFAGAIHKEIHETIDRMNKKFYTSVRGVNSILNPNGPGWKWYSYKVNSDAKMLKEIQLLSFRKYRSP